MSHRPLWKHQIDAFHKSKDKAHFAYLFEPGCGKTRVAIEFLRNRFNADKCFYRTLIIAPTITLQNWRNEFLTYSKIPAEKIVVLDGSGADKVKKMALEMSQDPRLIVITNFESVSLEGLNSRGLRSLLESWEPEVSIVDEMHKIKGTDTKRHKHVLHATRNCKFRLGLTGTPILNTPMDIFGQWLYLDRGATFGHNLFVFRNKYFIDKNRHMPRHVYFPNWVPKAKAVEEIKSLISPHSASALKKEVLDLPPLIKTQIPVVLDGEQARMYKQMKDEFITWVKGSDQAVVANTAITKLVRLLQIANGFVKDESGTEVTLKNNGKDRALKELLDKLDGQKVIIWASFKHDYKVIRAACAMLKLKMVECHGDTPNAEKFANVERFNEDPSVKVFLGHPQSLGIGVNLTAASYMIYYSRTFSLENDTQSEARNYRGGSEIHDKITRYDIVAQDTVDEHCLKALENKSKVSLELLLGWLE